MSVDDRLDALVGSVSDGTPIDWERTDSSLVESEQASVRALRDVARIAEFSRQLQRTPDAGAEILGRHDDSPPLERWGDLTLLEPLGAGASGHVWRAWDSKLRREVALKFLQRGSGGKASTGARSEAGAASESRLLDEARALARVRHPSVVAVYGIAEHDGWTGMWMERLHGATLAETIEQRGALPPREVARIGRELCRALEAVHAAGLVHRDIKPSNVVLEPGGRVVLTDFGLGRRRGYDDSEARRVSGTPVFMSPELLSGEPPTPRSDLYALGVTLRWALTGHSPFRAGNIEELKAEVKTGPATPLVEERPDSPNGLIAAIERAMAPQADARFADATKMAEALESAATEMELGGRSAWRSSSRMAVAAVLLLALAATSVWLATQNLGARSPRSPQESKVGASTARTDLQAPNALATYNVEATLVDRSGGAFRPLAPGDRVSPGNRLSLRFHGSRPTWVYVLNQDEQGETYLLFPQPLFDVSNPISPDSAMILPGPIGGQENGWTVTSRGGREHFLVVASPQPIPEIESELSRLPAAKPGRPIQYASIQPATIQRLRGVGGVSPLPANAPRGEAGPFERFRALTGRETVSDSIWVRQITLENPLR